jgi:hypothetical protein
MTSLWELATLARRTGRARRARLVEGRIGGGEGSILSKIWLVNGCAAVQRGMTADWHFVPETQARQVQVQDLGEVDEVRRRLG